MMNWILLLCVLCLTNFCHTQSVNLNTQGDIDLDSPVDSTRTVDENDDDDWDEVDLDGDEFSGDGEDYETVAVTAPVATTTSLRYPAVSDPNDDADAVSGDGDPDETTTTEEPLAAPTRRPPKDKKCKGKKKHRKKCQDGKWGGKGDKSPERPGDQAPVFTDSGTKQMHDTSLDNNPTLMAAIIGGAIAGLVCAVLLTVLIVYRMKKKDEGSYALDEPRKYEQGEVFIKSPKEFYA